MLNTAIGIPSAKADPCPDVEVVFARGTFEPPGIGLTGQAFVNSLRPQVGERSLGVYAVNYPAGPSVSSFSAGTGDVSAHVQYMAANCPNTRMVLGGMSQGARVIDLVTASGEPSDARFTAAPMPPQVADHVAAVAVFGNARRKAEGPLTARSPLYGSKTIDVCARGDSVCGEGGNGLAHYSYILPEVVSDAAAFAASRL
jgi:cutinase